MSPLGESGQWELFLPNPSAGHLYQFELVDCHGDVQLRTDPWAVAYERAPEAAAVICNEHAYVWSDGGWMGQRPLQQPFQRAISIYELHLDSSRRVPEEGDSQEEIAPQLAAYWSDMGFTHVEFLPLFDGSWEYQRTGYFAPTARYGGPDDFTRPP
jgi:1,4-alpha-glucan branching enzyme